MNILSKKWFSEPKLMIGIMTGTSVDAIDTVLVRFDRSDGSTKFDIITYDEYPIQEETIDRINKAVSNSSSVKEISELHFELSRLYAQSAKKIMEKSGINPKDIDGIGIHGQTVRHDPEGSKYIYPNTLQLGSLPVVSNITGIPVAGDFRSADIAVGGKGAPLVPIFDLEFLSCGFPVVTLNIGGIANITCLPPKNSKGRIYAFDTGPGNCLIDSYMREHFNEPFDNKGLTASAGNCDLNLLNKLLDMEYFRKEPPKSTGRELFNINNINAVINTVLRGISDADLIRTLTEFTAETIASGIKQYAAKSRKVFAAGGGTSNIFLMDLIKEKLPEMEIVLSDETGIPSDAKEAICFAYLAYLCFGAEKSPVSKITGADRDVILGVISLP